MRWIAIYAKHVAAGVERTKKHGIAPRLFAAPHHDVPLRRVSVERPLRHRSLAPRLCPIRTWRTQVDLHHDLGVAANLERKLG
jgi:hypothetical protein